MYTSETIAAPTLEPRPLRSAAGSDEDLLLAALRAGDPKAYERLVCTHGGRMLAVSRRLLRCEEDARDAVQDAFLQAFRALPGFAGQSCLGTWLHPIAVNACLMRLVALCLFLLALHLPCGGNTHGTVLRLKKQLPQSTNKR